MQRILTILLVALLATLSLDANALAAQTSVAAKLSNENGPPAPPQGLQDYVCPMDADVRSDKPGVCSRCGMKLVLGIPEELEYPVDLVLSPRVFHAGDRVQMAFRISDPKTSKNVTNYEIVHEKLFHLFIVSDDLKYFLHDHPVPQQTGHFSST